MFASHAVCVIIMLLLCYSTGIRKTQYMHVIATMSEVIINKTFKKQRQEHRLPVY